MRFLSALSFLTIIPVPARTIRDDTHQVLYFPLVGLLIGLVALGVDEACRLLLFPEIRPVLVVLSLAVVTGGLHLDGLADSADGLLSHKDRKTQLEIMRDPRVGAMGVMAIVFGVALKITAVSALTGKQYWVWLVAAPAFARTAQVAGLVLFDYARPEGGGMSRYFQKYRWSWLTLAWIPMALVFLAGPTGGALAVLVSLVVTFGFFNYVNSRLGGLTGDILGAGSELVEISLLITGAVYCVHL